MTPTHEPNGLSTKTVKPEKAKMSDGKKFLIALLAFFGVVFTADGILIYLSLTSSDGLVVKDYYEQGINYDAVIQTKKRQAELGWQFELAHPETVGTGPLELTLKDGEGLPLSGKTIAARVRRPAEKGYDQHLTFTEVSPGTYRAEVTLPLQGRWNLEARVRDAQDEAQQDLAIFESRFLVSS